MATLEFLETDANDQIQGYFPGWEIVSAFFWCDFEKYILLLFNTFKFQINCFARLRGGMNIFEL